MSRRDRLALISAAAAIGLSMTPAEAARLIEPTGYAEMRQLVAAHPEIDRAILPGLGAAPLLFGRQEPAPDPGATVWTNYGSFTFIVPDKVRRISGVCIGGGGGGGGHNGSWAGRGGGGGALVYSNDISVTPGEELTVIVGRGGNAGTSNFPSAPAGTASRVQRGGIDLLNADGGGGGGGGIGGRGGEGGLPILGDVGFAGGPGNTTSQGGPGGGAGGYTAAGVLNGPGVPLEGTTGPANPVCGRGGNGRTGSSAGTGTAGRAGGVRIIWGAGFSYPDNAVIP